MGLKDLLKHIDDESDLAVMLDHYLETKQQSYKPDGKFHPSMAGDCPRSIYYYMMGEKKEPFSAQAMRRMDNGTWQHKRYEDYLEKAKLLVSSEESFEFEYRGVKVKGKYDAIIKVHGSNRLFEFKTVNGWGFKALKEPKNEHFEQWNIYAFSQKVYDGIILYENKDTQELKQFNVRLDMARFNKTMDKFVKVQKAVDDGRIIRKPYKGMSDKNCVWCDYKERCWRK